MKLNAARRNALDDSEFAGPDRSYPVDTRARAVAAKGRATQAVEAGRMSASEASKIKSKANAEIRRTGGEGPAGKHWSGR